MKNLSRRIGFIKENIRSSFISHPIARKLMRLPAVISHFDDTAERPPGGRVVKVRISSPMGGRHY